MAQNLTPAGRLAVAYYSTDDTLITTDVPTWLEAASTVPAGNIADASQNTDPTFANTNTRENTAGGFTSQKPVIRQGEITFEMLHRTTNAANSFESKILSHNDDLQPMAMAFFDYPAKQADLETGDKAMGLAANWYVSGTKTEEIEDVQRWAITLTQQNKGQYVEITGT